MPQIVRSLLTCTLCALALSAGARAQSASNASQGYRATGAFIGLSVPDVEASARWYTEKLGLKAIMRMPRTNGTAVAILEGNGLIVELIQADAARPLKDLAPQVTTTVNVHGLFKAGAIVDDYDGLLALLRQRGVPIALGPFPARDGMRANFLIRDNAGNLIQFFGR